MELDSRYPTGMKGVQTHSPQIVNVPVWRIYYKEVPEIEMVQCSKSMEAPPPPPTAQMPGSNWLIFWLKTPRFLNFILEAEI